MHGSFDTHHLGPIAIRAITNIALAKPETHFLFIGRETDAVKKLAKRVFAVAPFAKLECTGFVPYGEVAQRLGPSDRRHHPVRVIERHALRLRRQAGRVRRAWLAGREHAVGRCKVVFWRRTVRAFFGIRRRSVCERRHRPCSITHRLGPSRSAWPGASPLNSIGR